MSLHFIIMIHEFINKVAATEGFDGACNGVYLVPVLPVHGQCCPCWAVLVVLQPSNRDL